MKEIDVCFYHLSIKCVSASIISEVTTKVSTTENAVCVH